MSSIFIYVSDENIDSFKNNKSLYQDKIAFLGTTKKIVTMNHEYGGEDNVIESISVNGTTQSINNKNVNITVPAEVTESTVSSWGFIKSGETSEIDPTVPSYVKNITESNITAWNAKVTKEELSAQAYLQSFDETDPIFLASVAHGITSSNISKWNSYQANIIESISVNNTAQTINGKNINIDIPSITKGTTSGNGNAVTDISVSNHEITLTKGTTFLTTHQDIKSLNNESLVGDTNIELTIVKEQTPESGFLATYKLKQGTTQIGASINIPKDYLIKSGEVKTVTTANTPYNGAAVGDKYLDFTVNVQEGSATDTHMYIPVNDLVDAYTEGNGIDISNSNVVSIQIDSSNANGLATTSNGLKLGLASGSSAGAMSSSDFTKLSGIPSISSSNNGQILQVVNGAWTLVTPATIYVGSASPNNNDGNNGDIYLQE